MIIIEKETTITINENDTKLLKHIAYLADEYLNNLRKNETTKEGLCRFLDIETTDTLFDIEELIKKIKNI